jgi:rhodanese-related sulfurtransferase
MIAIGPKSTMAEILGAYPGAQRALFRKYHIGGCSSCGFQPTETLEQLCKRNNDLNVQEVVQHIQTSHEGDKKILITSKEVDEKLKKNEELKLLDIRTREEWEAVHLQDSVLLTQEVMQSLLASWPREKMLVIYDHQGVKALDAAAYFLGHGFQNVRCIRGGIDAWSQEVDPDLPRYELERKH